MNKQSSPVDLTNQSVFGLTKAGSTIALTAPLLYKTSEQTTVTSIKFNMRLGEIFSDFDDFDWTNVFLAGGLVSGLLETNYNKELYKDSDLDFFIYAKTKKEMISAYIRTYDYFKKKFNNNIHSFIYNNSMVTTILSSNCKRVIQLIGSPFDKPIDIINNFDMTHCQVGFNGQIVISTPEFIKAAQTRITQITKSSIHAYRIVKAYQRGYSIELPNFNLYIKNYFHTYIFDDDKHPINTDKYWFIDKMEESIQELIANPTVQQNLKKNYIPTIEEEQEDEVIWDKIRESYSKELVFIIDPLAKY